MTFRQFLHGYRRQQSAIGDLARDVAVDRDAPRTRPDTLDAWRQHLEDVGASDNALATLDTAWKQYLEASAELQAALAEFQSG